MTSAAKAILLSVLALGAAALTAEPSGLAVEPGAPVSSAAAASALNRGEDSEPCLPTNPNLPAVLARLLPCRSPLKPEGLILYSLLSRMQLSQTEGLGPLTAPLSMPLRSLLSRDSQPFVVLPPLSTVTPVNFDSRWQDGLSTLTPFRSPAPAGALLPATAVPLPMAPPSVPAEARPPQLPMPHVPVSPPPPITVPMPSSTYLPGAAAPAGSLGPAR